MLVVLDSNLLFSALISPHGTPAKIYEAWQEGRFELVTCREQIEEIRRASRYPKLRAVLQPHLVGKMLNALQRARVVDHAPRKHSTDDPTDEYLLNLADFSGAHYLVTGDKRSGMLKRRKVGSARILPASGFKKDVLD